MHGTGRIGIMMYNKCATNRTAVNTKFKLSESWAWDRQTHAIGVYQLFFRIHTTVTGRKLLTSGWNLNCRTLLSLDLPSKEVQQLCGTMSQIVCANVPLGSSKPNSAHDPSSRPHWCLILAARNPRYTYNAAILTDFLDHNAPTTSRASHSGTRTT